MSVPADPLTLASATRIDALCDQLEAEWRAGRRMPIEEFLATLPLEEHPAAVTALLRVELELRQRTEALPSPAEYVARFPDHAAAISAVFAELARPPETDTSGHQTQTQTLSLEGDQTARLATDEPQPTELGRFLVLGKLGEGAFGTVYRARDPQLDREVAIKVPRVGTLAQPEDVERFLRESKVAATMQHPNICPVYEVGTANGRPFIVMALVPGKSLADHLKSRREPFPQRQAALIIRKLALALELAHQKGIIHRDLKPANILIDDDRKDVVVMDFGLARREQEGAAQLTHSGMLMGTPAYMSPEQARGDTAAIGPASDVYSLGVMLYELLAGERPFAGTIGEVLGKILHVDPAPPSSIRTGVDPALEAIALRAMAKEPAERYASMRALADALGNWLKGQASPATPIIPAPPIPTPAPLLAKNKSRPRWLVMAGLCLAALLAAAVFFLQTPYGTVRIEIHDPAIKVALNKDGATFQGVDKQHEIKLQSGKHGLTITRGDFTFDTAKFELKKRGKTTLAIELLDGKIRVAQDGKVLSSQPLPTAAASHIVGLEFDGIDDYVLLPSIEYDRKSPLTFEAWITPALGQDQTKTDALFAIWANQASALSIAPWGWHFYYAGHGAHGGIGGRVQAGRRSHVVGQWDGSQCQLFVDGAPMTGGGDPENPVDSNRTAAKSFLPRVLGASGNRRGEVVSSFFPGRLYEVRISTIARYAKNFAPPAPDEPFSSDEHTLALYHFDEGQGIVLNDSSGNGHHGKIVGAKWISSDLSANAAPPASGFPLDHASVKNRQQEWADYLGVPVEKQVNLPGGEILSLVLIPPGDFRMGSSADEQARFMAVAYETGKVRLASEGPQHRVRITRPFYLGKYEVTQSQWKSVMGANPSEYQDRPDRPVEMLSWDEIQPFLKKLNDGASAEGVFALPTEAQWEYACRAGTQTPWHCGDEGAELREWAWFYDEATARQQTHPVGQLKPNAFGLYDLHGNVREWCADWHAVDYYANSTTDDPQGPNSGTNRVLRGGSWFDRRWHCRSAYRIGHEPTSSNSRNGFRLALSIGAERRAPEPIANTALQFDGIDDYVQIDDWQYDGSHPLTVEAWVTPEKLPKGVEIISASEQSGFNLAIWKDDRWAFSIVTDSSPVWATAPFKPEHANRRRHVAGVFDRQQVRLYVDGVEMQRVAAPDPYKRSTQPLILGGNPNGNKIVFHYAGLIDEVRISRVGRYAGKFLPRERFEPDSETLALYHFDEGAGDVLKDSSGNNRHGKIAGAKWVSSDAHRAAAEWAMRMRGTIRIALEGKSTHKVQSAAQLPDKPFQLAGLYIEYPPVPFDNAGITKLNGLQSLETLGIEHDGLTNEAFCQLAGLPEVYDLGIHGTQLTDVSLEHVATMPKVRRLNFGRTAVIGKRLDKLRTLDLELLILHDTPVGDEALAHLPLFPSLFHLGLGNTKITDAGLPLLSKLSKLTFLDLGGTGISGAGLAALKDSPVLERLRLVDAASVDDAAVAHLAELQQLRILELNGTGISAAGLARLRTALPKCEVRMETAANPGQAAVDRTAAKWALQVGGQVIVQNDLDREIALTKDLPLPEEDFRVKSINLNDKQGVTATDLEHLRGLKCLAHLHLANTPLDDTALVPLKEVASLTSLDLGGIPLSDAGLVHLQGLTNLQVLRLDGTRRLTDTGLSRLKELSNLQTLSLRDAQITDEGLAHLRELKRLTSLQLNHTPIHGAGLAHLTDMKLTVLNLGGTQVTDDALAHLSRMPSLRHLWLRDSKITDDGLKHLVPLDELFEIGLENTQVSDKGLRYLQELKDIRWLFLSDTQVSDAGLELLAGKKLWLLDLQNTPITDAGIDRLRTLPSLEILWLSGTKITDRSLETIGELKNLTDLNLNRANITDSGLTRLQPLKRLKILGLVGTKVTDAGIAGLKSALPNCNVVR